MHNKPDSRTTRRLSLKRGRRQITEYRHGSGLSERDTRQLVMLTRKPRLPRRLGLPEAPSGKEDVECDCISNVFFSKLVTKEREVRRPTRSESRGTDTLTSGGSRLSHLRIEATLSLTSHGLATC